MSNMASRIWNRLATLGRDGVTISRAFAQAANPILRRQDKHTTLGDAFRNVIVAQARQSNTVAASVLSLQQQIGLIQYHGVWDYLRQRQALLQSSSSSASSTANGTVSVSTSSSSSPESSSSTGSVAKVAFMITASMRKELSERLGYSAESIKSLTPKEASLILHHGLKPEDKDDQLPGILQAHEAEQEKLRQQEQERAEEEKRQLELQRSKEKREEPAQSGTTVTDSKMGASPASTIGELNEGLATNELQANDNLQASEGTKTVQQASDPVKEVHPAPYSLETPPFATNNMASSPLSGSHTMQEWYEVIETRTDDGTSSAVLLFDTEDEADMAMDLKKTFAERRAKEDKDNHDNTPATTYFVQKTLK